MWYRLTLHQTGKKQYLSRANVGKDVEQQKHLLLVDMEIVVIVMVGRIMPPTKHVHILIPTTCEHGTFYWTEDGIKVAIKDREKHLDYPDGPSVIIGCLKVEERGRRENQKRCDDRNRAKEILYWWRWRWRKGPQTKECWWSLYTRKAKETDYLQEGTQPFQHLNFSPTRLMSDFWTIEIYNNKFVLFLDH